MIRESCPDCGSNKVVEQFRQGHVVCSDCGLVLDRIIDMSSQNFSSVDNGGNNLRTGPPVSNLRPDYGLSTDIGNGSRDASGTKLTSLTRHKMRRLRWMNARTSKSEIRNLRTALRELKRLAAALQLPQEAQSTASFYYRKALKKKLIRGRSINSMIAAAVYIAAREHDFAIVLKDLEDSSEVEKKIIARCMRVYMIELNIKPKVTRANSMIARLTSKLELTQETENEARKILEEARKQKLDIGKSPMSVAAAVIYLACLRTGERRTQQMVAEAAMTTPVTLRNRFRAISEALTVDVEVKRGAAATPVFFRPPVKLGRKKD
ncbi:MAG: transcription initiation factor IIB [Candidatus Heimdallarchaeota archaeon]|nr:transcription initiation factor IIB [Candidatus Heimdallarchaeota archaeon]